MALPLLALSKHLKLFSNKGPIVKKLTLFLALLSILCACSNNTPNLGSGTGPDTTSGSEDGSGGTASSGGDSGSGSTGDATTPSCGNGVTEAGEECDDGNAVESDACLNNCKAAQCGDGIVQVGVEACDDGNKIESDACLSNCTPFVLEQHLWSQAFEEGKGSIEDFSVKTDSEGNIYLAGDFLGRINLGGDDLVNAQEVDSLTIDYFDIFLAKFDKDGKHLWSKSFPILGWQRLYDLAIDSQNNLIITGYHGNFQQIDPLNFSDNQDPQQDLPDSSPHFASPYLAKFDKDGHHLWSKSFQSGAGGGTAVAVNNADEIYLTGTLDFAGIDFGGGNIKSSSNRDVYVAKFSPAGAHLLSKLFPGDFEQYPSQIAIDTAGNPILSGNFAGNIKFDAITLNSSSTNIDLSFIAKLHPDLSTEWARSLGADGGYASIISLALDSQDRPLLVGQCWDAFTLNGETFCDGSYPDSYLIRLNNDGSFANGLALHKQWAIEAVIDSKDQAYLSGETYTAPLPLSIAGSTIPLAGEDLNSIYLAQLSPDNQLLKGLSYATFDLFSQWEGLPRRMTVDSSDNLTLAGHFSGNLSFGGELLQAAENGSFYLVKLKPLSN